MEVLFYNDNRRLFLVDVMRVFGIAKEGDSTSFPFFNLAGFPYSGVFVSFDSTLDNAG